MSVKDDISRVVAVEKSMPMGAGAKKITDAERNIFAQWVSAGTPLGQAAPQPTPTPSSGGALTYKATILPLINKYCSGCHGDGNSAEYERCNL